MLGRKTSIKWGPQINTSAFFAGEKILEKNPAKIKKLLAQTKKSTILRNVSSDEEEEKDDSEEIQTILLGDQQESELSDGDMKNDPHPIQHDIEMANVSSLVMEEQEMEGELKRIGDAQEAARLDDEERRRPIKKRRL